MDPIRIRSVADLESFPEATARSSYLSEDSGGSEDTREAVLRAIATWEQDARDHIEPDKPERLPMLLATALAALEAEGLELWGEVREPGAAPIAMHFVQMGVTRVTEATLVVIRFSTREITRS